MKLVKLLLILLFVISNEAMSQGSFPWERPLKMAWSADGITFNQQAVFQDSSGVPSAIRWKGDTLVCAFQWFRQPKNTSTWDRVAVKFSYNKGVSWTSPKPIIISGFPSNYQRPFDPTLAVFGKDSIRIYFSSGENMNSLGLDASINTYSAKSADGINYTFEPNPRFDHPTTKAIDPAVIYFDGKWHYTAPAGPPQAGAYHATSSNGLNFTQQTTLPSDFNHNWTGNLLVDKLNELRFYGSGMKVWFNTSKDGFIWDGYVNTNVTGGDPTVVKIASNSYLIIYVGETYITPLEAKQTLQVSIYPNPTSTYLNIPTLANLFTHYSIFDAMGKEMSNGEIKNAQIGIENLSLGLYFLYLRNLDGQRQIFKFIKE